MPITQLYPILVERNLISPTIPRQYDGPPPRDFDPNATCDFHFGAAGHSIENYKVLKHLVQDLLDHRILKFEGVPNIKTNPLPNHLEGDISAILVEEDDCIDFNAIQVPWKKLFYALKMQGYLGPAEACNEESFEGICEYNFSAQEHSLEDCKDFKKEVPILDERGIIRKEAKKSVEECIINQVRFTPHEKVNFQARMEKIKENFEEYCEKRNI
jgi:hypothetical protein